MGKVMIIDITKCNGCHNCQVACKDEHCGNDWSPIAKPQPLTGQFWNQVIDRVRGQVPKVRVAYEHSICQHCDDAPCLRACPEQAIYKREDGIVIIDPLVCKGSHNCIEACPYPGVIFFNEDLRIAQKCTFCAHLLDQEWTETRCSEVCPTGAFTFGEEEDLGDLIARAEVLRPAVRSGGPEFGSQQPAKPRVYYIGLPKLFVAGCVYDPDADEVVEGAQVTLSSDTGEAVAGVATDEFGDFWLEGLNEGTYRVSVQKPGYALLEVGPFHLTEERNLGDLPMQREGGRP